MKEKKSKKQVTRNSFMRQDNKIMCKDVFFVSQPSREKYNFHCRNQISIDFTIRRAPHRLHSFRDTRYVHTRMHTRIRQRSVRSTRITYSYTLSSSHFGGIMAWPSEFTGCSITRGLAYLNATQHIWGFRLLSAGKLLSTATGGGTGATRGQSIRGHSWPLVLGSSFED